MCYCEIYFHSFSITIKSGSVELITFCTIISLIVILNAFFSLQRWRRRWFVLRQGDLPGQYFLEYYTDKKCLKLKGKIDLDHCEQVCFQFKWWNLKFIFYFYYRLMLVLRAQIT